MKIYDVLKTREYAAIFVASTCIFAAAYIYTQVLGAISNIGLWLTIIPWYNAVLFVTFAVLFGMTVSYQIYLKSQPKVCGASVRKKGAGLGSSATFLGFLVAQCPACASIGALFLPATVVLGFFTRFSTIINIASIALMLFTLNYLGAFKQQ